MDLIYRVPHIRSSKPQPEDEIAAKAAFAYRKFGWRPAGAGRQPHCPHSEPRSCYDSEYLVSTGIACLQRHHPVFATVLKYVVNGLMLTS